MVANDETFGVSLPLAGLTLNHEADGVPIVHVSVPPPIFVMLIDCAAGLLPAGVE
jgi:hypothetical protein